MGKSTALDKGPPPGPVKTFKYGMPLYGLAWPEGDTFYVCGGGGHGIKNRLVSAEAHNGSLTDQTAEFLFGPSCPTRLVVSPGARSIVFATGNSGIQRLDLDVRGKVPRFTEVTGSLAEKLSAVKMEVKALSFHPSGDFLALGGDDGTVAVYEWPSMKAKWELGGERKLGESVKDLDFVPLSVGSSGGGGGGKGSAGKALMVILDNGSAVVVDVDKGGSLLCRVQLAKGPEFKNDKVMLVSNDDRLLLHHLPPGMENAQFTKVKCRVAAAASSSPSSSSAAATADGEHPPPPRAVLTCLMNNRSGCHVGLWELDEDGLLSMREACKAADAPATCMDVSADGALVAVGTSEGDVALVGCKPHMRVVKRFAKCHMVFTTNIALNADASYVLSASADASATLNSTAVPPTDYAKWFKLALILFTIVMMCLLQVTKVLRQKGYTMKQILAMAGLRPRDEL